MLFDLFLADHILFVEVMVKGTALDYKYVCLCSHVYEFNLSISEGVREV